jgi:hypothetical protein
MASFVAFAVLMVIGLTGFALNLRYGPKERRSLWWCPLAAPFFFGLQQGAEGFVWLHIQESDDGVCDAAAIFSFFAYVWWPFFVPIMGLSMACHYLKRLDNKSIKLQALVRCCPLVVLLGLGLLVSAYFATGLYGPSGSYEAVITNNHRISYDIQLLQWGFDVPGMLAITALYLLCTGVPFFIAVPHREVHWFWAVGIVFISSSAICYGIFPKEWPSTWCFFSAWISILIEAVFLVDLLWYKPWETREVLVKSDPQRSKPKSACASIDQASEADSLQKLDEIKLNARL